MATLYVSHTGSNTSPYDTWAKAATKLATATAAAAAGDTIYVAHDHAESTAGTVTITLPTSTTVTTSVICANSGAEPPTATATTAVVAMTGANDFNIAGGAGYFYGINFEFGGGGANAVNVRIANTANQSVLFRACSFALQTTASSRSIQIVGSSAYAGKVDYVDCEFSFAEATQFLGCQNIAVLALKNCIFSGASLSTGLFSLAPGLKVWMEGCDLSNVSSSAPLTRAGTYGRLELTNCKLPASWAGGLTTGTVAAALEYIEMRLTDNTGATTRIARQNRYGLLMQETTLVRDGGSPLAWKIATTSGASRFSPFATGTIEQAVVEAGSSKTVTCEILHDSVTDLTDADIWLEVQYLSESGSPLTAMASSEPGLLATGTALASSSETWTTTGMTNPNKQKLAVTFTPQLAGPISARIVVAKPSTTVYVCPKLTVT